VTDVLAGTSAEDILGEMSAEDVLMDMSAEDVLMDMSAEDVLMDMSAKDTTEVVCKSVRRDDSSATAVVVASTSAELVDTTNMEGV
jgi:hypothetical protein